jgi:hypothetical protein
MVSGPDCEALLSELEEDADEEVGEDEDDEEEEEEEEEEVDEEEAEVLEETDSLRTRNGGGRLGRGRGSVFFWMTTSLAGFAGTSLFLATVSFPVLAFAFFLGVSGLSFDPDLDFLILFSFFGSSFRLFVTEGDAVTVEKALD